MTEAMLLQQTSFDGLGSFLEQQSV